MRIKGGHEIDLAWKAGELSTATLKSHSSQPATFRYRGRTWPLDPGPEQLVDLLALLER
jgi:hypothetical protein